MLSYFFSVKTITIGTDPYKEKDIKKLVYHSDDIPQVQLFNSSDVISGNPGSNIAIGFVYTWKSDAPPVNVHNLMQRLSNYAALTGLWRTTNGGRYVFSNIVANPNINKLVLLVFGQKDNGHLLVNACENFWRYGTDGNGIIKNCAAANPKFEQVPKEALERVRKQADLLIVRNITDGDDIEPVIKALIQEPENGVPVSSFKDLDISFYSNVLKSDLLYDDGARFDSPLLNDLSAGAKNVSFKSSALSSVHGQSVQASNLSDAVEKIASFVFEHGSASVDMRNLKMKECRSISVTIMDPLETIPESFSEEYIKQYVAEFMDGVNKDSEFAYTYHERIFKRWGNQVEKVIDILKQNPNTRRACISLWDPFLDLGSPTPPCLDFIWLCVRDRKLELHALYRSHHLATVTSEGKLMLGEGAFVPNMYALGTLQKFIADRLDRDRGPLILTDFSGHIHIADI